MYFFPFPLLPLLLSCMRFLIISLWSLFPSQLVFYLSLPCRCSLSSTNSICWYILIGIVCLVYTVWYRNRMFLTLSLTPGTTSFPPFLSYALALDLPTFIFVLVLLLIISMCIPIVTKY